MTYQTTVICYMLVQIGGGLSSDGTMIIFLLYSMPKKYVCLYISLYLGCKTAIMHVLGCVYHLMDLS